MKTIGTLEEIGAKVGDVVECIGEGGNYYFNHCAYTVVDEPVCGVTIGWYVSWGKWRIVTKSPVRNVTCKEIVPGVYGNVKVHDPGSIYVRINVDAAMSTSDLTAAIATLTEIRDAMLYEDMQ